MIAKHHQENIILLFFARSGEARWFSVLK